MGFFHSVILCVRGLGSLYGVARPVVLRRIPCPNAPRHHPVGKCRQPEHWKDEEAALPNRWSRLKKQHGFIPRNIAEEIARVLE